MCTYCEDEKPLSEFSPHSQGKYGRYPRCKVCVNLFNRMRREKRAEEEGRPFYPWPQSEEERLERLKRSKRRGHLKEKFGISLEQYEEMLEGQQYRCAICRRHQDDLGTLLGVDHDRRCCPGKKSCGQCVRALLCFPCNSALGRFQDNIGVISNALEFISNPPNIPLSPEEKEEQIREQKRRGDKARYLKYNYGITLMYYEEMLERQSFCCAICGYPEKECYRGLDVDHDHETGAIRGLLCNPCNTAMGGFHDNLEILSQARHYLETFSALV